MSNNLSWLRGFSDQVIESQEHPVVDVAEILMHQLITLLKSPAMDESSLIDLVGMDLIYLLPELLDRRQGILNEWSGILASGGAPLSSKPAAMGETLSQIRLVRESDAQRQKQLRKQQQKRRQGPTIMGYDDEISLLAQLGWTSTNTRTRAPEPSQGTLGVGGPKVTLPEGTTRHLFEGYEEYRIPASVPSDAAKEESLVPVSRLPKWAASVFTDSPFLNRIQSKVFPVAFHQSDNFLMCAPTGAGKTNVALLAVCRLVNEWKQMPNPPPLPKFKVVYLAPMKALVSEIVEKFSKKLEPLLVSVREFTGDISIPRKELESVNVIVTVPEKWDILMRNLGKVSAAVVPGEESQSILSQVKLMIIDEVHLLNDERGAVIESIMARTLQFAEATCASIRCVALSATFPNFADIAEFLGVSKSNTFFFDSTFRPVPLEQTITGVGQTTGTAGLSGQPVARNVAEGLNKVTAEKVVQVLKEGEQVMVFVHSRNDTIKTADALIDLISAKLVLDRGGATDILKPKVDTPFQAQLLASVAKHSGGSSNRTKSIMNNLIQSGITIHHAGMLRPERSLAENLFKEGIARVLVCTATLAWGVNLPSRYVIIKGTSIWDSAVGGFRDIDMLDILQIFGRAGRPQFDTIGRATLVTSRDRLDHFLRLMTSQIPIESRFRQHLPDALNAEIAMGNISTLDEAVSWLRYTYMFVRFFKAPQKYGIGVSDIGTDPQLIDFRRGLINAAAETLNQGRLIRISRAAGGGGTFSSTDLGRVAAHFYVKYETAEMFSTKLRPEMSDSEIIELIGNAHEFHQLKCREDEMEELDTVAVDKTICPITKLRGGGMTSVAGKVGVLLQVYISRNYFFQSSSLASDMNYISQNVNRLFRCLFEVSLTRSVGVSGVSQRLLEWCKMVERRLWIDQHFLYHYCTPPSWLGVATVGGPKCLKEYIVSKLENRKMTLEKIWDIGGLSKSEIGAIVNHQPDSVKSVQIFLGRIPKMEISHRVIPISADLVKVDLELHLVNPEWSDQWSGMTEPFHVFVNDVESEDLYFHTHLVVHKKERYNPIEVSTIIPLTDPRPAQLTVSVVSDRYVGLEFFDTITLPNQKIMLTQSKAIATTLLDLYPLPKSALKNSGYESLFNFTHFNPIQTQLFHQLYHQDGNILVGAPTGSGKTVLAELATFRVFNSGQGKKVIYIAPMKALSRERIYDWQARLGNLLGRKVVELTGDSTPDARALHQADVLVTTPEKWDGISRNWKSRDYVKQVALVIIDEIHLLGQERGAILEVIVSRMRYMAAQTRSQMRFVGLSTALANATEVASWLNVSPYTGLFNFKPSLRPVPMTVHVQGYPGKHYCPRMATMNKPALQAIKTYSLEKPVIVFVSSRRQTRLTAFDMITYATHDTSYYSELIQGPGHSPWLRLAPDDEPIEMLLERIENEALKHTISFGVGIHHAGLKTSDREIVEKLFQQGKIQILVATTTVGVGVNLPAHLVVVKGTEYFDAKTNKYVDMPVTDVLQMMGRAGRPQFDTSAVSVVMVHEAKKNFYRKFLYSPFPLESSLHTQLADHLNAEIASGRISCLEDAMEFLSWTYLFRRVSINPDFYMAADSDAKLRVQERVTQYLKDLVTKELKRLELSGCIKIVKPVTVVGGDVQIEPTRVGQIASLFYLKHATVSHFHSQLGAALPATGKSIFGMAKILADCAEFTYFPMRHKDDTYNEQLGQRLPLKLPEGTDWASPHTKGILIILAHMFHPPMPIQDYFTDLKSFLDQSVRIVQGMLETLMIDPRRTGVLSSLLNLLLLNQCLSLGTHPWVDLGEFMLGKKIGGFSNLSFPEIIEKFHSEKISGIDSKVYQLLAKMPLMRISTDRKGDEVLVTLKNENCKKSDEYCQTPISMLDAQNSGGKRRRVAWWILVGEKTTGHVFAARRVSLSSDSKVVKLSVPATEVTPTVLMISDCYLGIDQELSL